MTLEKLNALKAALKARGVDVDAMEAGDLYRRGLDRETRDVLGFDLTRRWSERRAAELAGR